MPADHNADWAANGATPSGSGLTSDMEAVLASLLAEDQAPEWRHAAEHRGAQTPARAVVDADHLRELNAQVPASPVARVLANKLGVYLAGVTGTGTGGRITPDDVRQQAHLRNPIMAASSSSRFPDPTPESVSPRASYPGWLAAARQFGPEPTLFATGNLPPFTASGIDVTQLLRVPWQARPAMATANTPAEALAIVEEVLSDPDPEAYASELFAQHHAVQDYVQAISSWLSRGQHEQMMRQPIQYPAPRQAGRADGF